MKNYYVFYGSIYYTTGALGGKCESMKSFDGGPNMKAGSRMKGFSNFLLKKACYFNLSILILSYGSTAKVFLNMSFALSEILYVFNFIIYIYNFSSGSQTGISPISN